MQHLMATKVLLSWREGEVRKRRHCQSRAITLTLSQGREASNNGRLENAHGRDRLHHVTKVWGADTPREVLALDTVSLRAQPGEFLVLSGQWLWQEHLVSDARRPRDANVRDHCLQWRDHHWPRSRSILDFSATFALSLAVGPRYRRLRFVAPGSWPQGNGVNAPSSSYGVSACGSSPRNILCEPRAACNSGLRIARALCLGADAANG
jgi:hypothetical protein